VTAATGAQALAARPLRVLLVEDSEDDATLVLAALRRTGYRPEFRRVDNAADMRAALAKDEWDVVLSDYDMPGFGGLHALELLRDSGLDLPFLIVSGTIGEETAVEAMKAGAHDYLMKDSLVRLGPAVEREIRDAGVRRERRNAALALEADARVFAALARVGRELIACSDTAGLLERLGQVTTEVLQCDGSYTLLHQAKDDSFVPVASFGGDPTLGEELRVLRVPRTAIAGLLQALAEHETYQVTMESPPSPWAGIPRRFGVTVMLYLALRQGDEIIGIHCAAHLGREEPFTPVQERIARGSAQLASMALQTVRVVEELETANRLKSDFVATMSHELRTPLNILLGYFDLLLGGEFGPVAAAQAEVLQRMDVTARELLELITATLDLSRLERSDAPMNWEDADVSVVLRGLATETGAHVDKPGLRIDWDVAADLPRLRTDVGKLTVLLRNLLSNAVKFTDDGTVSVSAHLRGDSVEIAIADTGIGISPEVLPIIFEPFRQGESSLTRRFGGVGLGLHIVQRLLALIGGTISVESTPLQGATFRVRLPLSPPS
jgi:signal transduction histidine kinase/CheY-like chemotaxis protein